MIKQKKIFNNVLVIKIELNTVLFAKIILVYTYYNYIIIKYSSSMFNKYGLNIKS